MKKVLIVEDYRDIRIILKKRLEDSGFCAEEVESGYHLLAYMREGEAPHALVLDLMLPGRSGADLLYSIHCKWPQCKIFVFSAHAEYKSQDTFSEFISGFFCKSDGTEALINAIKEQLKEDDT